MKLLDVIVPVFANNGVVGNVGSLVDNGAVDAAVPSNIYSRQNHTVLDQATGFDARCKKDDGALHMRTGNDASAADENANWGQIFNLDNSALHLFTN